MAFTRIRSRGAHPTELSLTLTTRIPVLKLIAANSSLGAADCFYLTLLREVRPFDFPLGPIFKLHRSAISLLPTDFGGLLNEYTNSAWYAPFDSRHP